MSLRFLYMQHLDATLFSGVVSKAMATLVKRSDAPLYRVFVGDDWKLFAWSLSHEQPFEINVVLHNPFTTPDAQDKVTAAVCCFGIVLKKNNWFEASQDQAMQVLAATLVPEQCCVDASCNALDSPAPKKRRAKCALPAPDCEQCAPPVADVATPVTPPAENTDVSGSDSPQSCVVAATEHDVDTDPLWEHVDKCAARDAAKAVDIRNALEARFGKETSKSLLANTKASVAQDASGRKNRVLRLGASYISLKSV